MVLGGGCGLLSSCLGRRGRRCKVGSDAPDLDPVLLVSGMGGTILNARSRKTGGEMRVWVRILLADLEFKKNLWSVYNAETETLLMLLNRAGASQAAPGDSWNSSRRRVIMQRWLP